MSTNNQRFKVLCLHGFRQDSAAFKAKSGGFRKLLKSQCDFEFIDAPFVIPQGEQNPNNEPQCLSWWFSGENPYYFSSKHVSTFEKGFAESIKKICDYIETNGPFDGILGFSQGASLLSLICVLKQLNEFPHDIKFVILVCGFKSLTSSHVSLYDRLGGSKLTIPSLHIIGQNDQVVDKSACVLLAQQYFHNPTIVEHPGGHTVPSQSIYKEQYLKFLEKINSS